MGRELYDTSARVRRFYAQASDLLGDDLARISFAGPAEKLKQTLFTQPAILIHSLALLDILHDNLPPHAYAAGHSLGEYAALVSCGALRSEDAITAVCARARLMEEACRNTPGTMAAILALPDEELEKICAAASTTGVVTMANINSSVQVAISGEVPAVEEACRLAGEAGAKRAVMLEVGGAFHSPLMASATDPMAACLEGIAIRDARPAVVANVTARPVTAADDIRRLLVDQITSPVRWRDTMAFFNAEGVTMVIEIGPGRVLTGLAKREMKDAVVLNIDTLADAQEVLAATPEQG